MTNVFVLTTGRSGSKTFQKACEHITNYTAAHESRCSELGESRLAYPENHIEVDNRLAWFLGRLEQKYGDNAVYVHLTRDQKKVATSYNSRWSYHGSLSLAYSRGLLKSNNFGIKPVTDMVQTIRENVEMFLSSKSCVFRIDIDSPADDFKNFWESIGAEGDMQAALDELVHIHNASDSMALGINAGEMGDNGPNPSDSSAAIVSQLNESLLHKHMENGRLAREIDRYLLRIETLEAKKSAVEITSKSTADTLAETRQKLSDAKEGVAGLSEKYQKAQLALEKKFLDNEALSSELDSTKTLLDEKSLDNEALSSELDSTKTLLDEKSLDNEALSSELDSTKTLLDEKSLDNEALSSELDSTKTLLDEKSLDNEALSSELDSTKTLLDEKSLDNEALSSELDSTKTLLDEKSLDNEALSSELDSTKTLLDEKSLDNEALSSELDSTKTLLDEKSLDNEALSSELDSTKTLLDQKSLDNEALSQELDSKEQLLETQSFLSEISSLQEPAERALTGAEKIFKATSTLLRSEIPLLHLLFDSSQNLKFEMQEMRNLNELAEQESTKLHKTLESKNESIRSILSELYLLSREQSSQLLYESELRRYTNQTLGHRLGKSIVENFDHDTLYSDSL